MVLLLARKGESKMKKGISQEGLKLIACLTMLIDHIGYELISPLCCNAVISGSVTFLAAEDLHRLYYLCRCVGRIALPIFAFLIVEGVHRTRNRKQYALRLALGTLIAEIPYDLMVMGEFVGNKQSVMVTLLLGFCAVLAMEKCAALAWKPVVVIPFAVLAELLNGDYGWSGVVLVALFELSRYTPRRNLVRFCGMLVLGHYASGMILELGNFTIPIQALAALSMFFIGAYDGRKLTKSKTAQWAFYLFYPVHMLILWFIGTLLPAGIAL